jgi:hypothetical protein
MARKRSPQYDFICIRCGCPCDEAGTRHFGGGQGMRACGKPPNPMLRSEYEADIRATLESVFLDRRRPV